MSMFDPSIPSSVEKHSENGQAASFLTAYQPSHRMPPIPPRHQPPGVPTSSTTTTTPIGESQPIHNNSTTNYYPNQPVFPSYSMPGNYPGVYNTNSGFHLPVSSVWNGGTFGYSQDPNNIPQYSLSHSLDQHLRPTLDTVNNVIQAINSLTMMVQSCFMAVYTSCRAVVSMADQMGRFSDKVINLLAKIKPLLSLRRLLSRILTLLRLKKLLSSTTTTNGTEEFAWSDSRRAAAASAVVNATSNDHFGNWVSMLFFVITMGLPLLIWRVIKSIEQEKEKVQDSLWKNGKRVKVNYSFNARNSDELTINANEHVTLAPSDAPVRAESGWHLARNNSGKVGLVPTSYLQVS